MKLIEIDGSQEEGGGAILRQSLCLSIITGKPFRIKHIRRNRPKPGLKAQHVKSVELARLICNAKVSGLFPGSEELEFYPGEVRSFKGTIDIGTAGSITLALQSVFIPMVFSKKNFSLRLIGGTDVEWSPTIDYFKDVFVPFFNGYADVTVSVLKRGYYPRGGGVVDVSVKSKSSLRDAKPLAMDSQISLAGIKGICHASKKLENNRVCEKLRDSALVLLKDFDVDTNFVSAYHNSESAGAGIFFYGVASCGQEMPCRIGSSALLDKSLDEEKAVNKAVSLFRETISKGCPCDFYLADQLIPLLALAKGKIRTSRITSHVKGNVLVAKIFTGSEFLVEEEKGLVSCREAA